MNLKWLPITVFLLLTKLDLLAADGCLIGSTLYTARASGAIQVELLANGMNVFKHVPPTSTNNCISGVRMGTCQVCHGDPAVGLNIIGLKILVCTAGLNLFAQVDSGVYYSSYVLECPLDDYSWALGASAAAFGIFVIRKRK